MREVFPTGGFPDFKFCVVNLKFKLIESSASLFAKCDHFILMFIGLSKQKYLVFCFSNQTEGI